MEPLEPDERSRLIVEYLAKFSRALSSARLERIAVARQTANPLYLRLLLDELRLWGEHQTLDARIDHYLAAPTITHLYARILHRYEADYERDRPGLVREAFTLLWAARWGLSEAELLELLGSDGPLPRAYWSPLYLAAEHSLVSRTGLIGFVTTISARQFRSSTCRLKEIGRLPTCVWQSISQLESLSSGRWRNCPGNWRRQRLGSGCPRCSPISRFSQEPGAGTSRR